MDVLRWNARLFGLLIVGLSLTLMVGINPAELSSTGQALAAAWLAALLGMVGLWRWEGIGGLLSVGGLLAFYGIDFAATGSLIGGPILPVCFLPGVSAIICWAYDR